MGKFKDLVLNENEKKQLNEAVGGVVSTPAINAGHGVMGQKSDAEMSGDSRIDTRGNFTFDASKLPGSSGDSDFSHTANPKQAFGGELNESPESVVLHEDDGGSVVIRETSDGQEVIIRAGSQERAFELDEEAAKKVLAFFG